MLRRNVDFFALFFIVLTWLAVSKAPSVWPGFEIPRWQNPVHFESVHAPQQLLLPLRIFCR